MAQQPNPNPVVDHKEPVTEVGKLRVPTVLVPLSIPSLCRAEDGILSFGRHLTFIYQGGGPTNEELAYGAT